MTGAQVSINTDAALKTEGWMSPEEVEWLAQQAQAHKSIVEIGSYLGRSTRALADNTPGIVYAFDDWGGPRERWWRETTTEAIRETIKDRFDMNLKDLIGSKVLAFTGDHSAIANPPSADMVFIDGDHEYESVKRDIVFWKKHMLPGGLMCGHDIQLAGVCRAVSEEFPNYKIPVGLIWEAMCV